jgi:hypothetical protein
MAAAAPAALFPVSSALCCHHDAAQASTKVWPSFYQTFATTRTRDWFERNDAVRPHRRSERVRWSGPSSGGSKGLQGGSGPHAAARSGGMIWYMITGRAMSRRSIGRGARASARGMVGKQAKQWPAASSRAGGNPLTSPPEVDNVGVPLRQQKGSQMSARVRRRQRRRYHGVLQLPERVVQQRRQRAVEAVAGIAAGRAVPAWAVVCSGRSVSAHVRPALRHAREGDGCTSAKQTAQSLPASERITSAHPRGTRLRARALVLTRGWPSP